MSYREKENYITRDPHPNSWRGHANHQIMKTYKHLFDNKMCADLGCNHGSCTFLLHDFKPCHVDGYDINERALNVARQTCQELNIQNTTSFIEADLQSIPVEDGYYDVITTFHVLEHIYPKDAKCVLQEMYRILKNKGHVIISIPYKMNYPDRCHVAFYDEHSLKTLFEEEGFLTVSCFEDNRWHEKGLLTGLFMKP